MLHTAPSKCHLCTKLKFFNDQKITKKTPSKYTQTCEYCMKMNLSFKYQWFEIMLKWRLTRHKMEHQSGWWGRYKMAVGSDRSGSASRDQPVCATQRHTLMPWVGRLIHSSSKLVFVREKKSTKEEVSERIWKHVPNNVTKSHFRNKRRKEIWIFARWVSVCKPHMGVASHAGLWLLWQRRPQVRQIACVRPWSRSRGTWAYCAAAAAATGNQLSNNKTWHRIRTQAFLTGCHNVRICIVTWRGRAFIFR